MGFKVMYAKYVPTDICFLLPDCLIRLCSPIYPISLPTSLSSFGYPFVVYPKRCVLKMGRM